MSAFVDHRGTALPAITRLVSKFGDKNTVFTVGLFYLDIWEFQVNRTTTCTGVCTMRFSFAIKMEHVTLIKAFLSM